MLGTLRARRVWLVRGDTFHSEFLSRNTALPFFFLHYPWQMLTWYIAVPNATSPPRQSASSKGAPKSQWGTIMLTIWGPILTGAPKFYDTGRLSSPWKFVTQLIKGEFPDLRYNSMSTTMVCSNGQILHGGCFFAFPVPAFPLHSSCTV